MAVACASLGSVSSKPPLPAKGTLPGQDPVYGTYASALLISWSRMNSRLSAERGISYGSQSCVDCPWIYKPGSRRRVGPEPRLEGQPCGCPVLKWCRRETWDVKAAPAMLGRKGGAPEGRWAEPDHCLLTPHPGVESPFSEVVELHSWV